MNLLFDFYGTLLTQKQAACFALRYIDDFSLAEIAQELDISPQAAVDFLKRGISSLERFEEHLALVSKHIARQNLTETITTQLTNLEQAIRDQSALAITTSLQLIQSSVSDIGQI